MNRAESILCRLGEECNETAQRVSKALLFGRSEIQPGQPLNNAVRLVDELHDIIGVAIMAYKEGLIPFPLPTEEILERKQAKVEKYLAYQQLLGTLDAA